MIKIFNILSRAFCIFLMIHLLAMSVCDDYLLKLFNKSNIEQTIEIEDNNSKDKSFEFDEYDDKYLVNPSSHAIYFHSTRIIENPSSIAYWHLQIALPQRISKILIPPPRA